MTRPRRFTSKLLDMSGGIIGGVSDFGRRVRHLRIADNVVLDPLGAMSARTGSQRLSSAVLTKAPHSVMEWVSSTGTGRIFVGADDTAGALLEATAGAFNAQTVPFTLQPSAKMTSDQLHGSLFVSEQGGSNAPMFFRGTGTFPNPANTWHTGVLPRPAFPALAANLPVSGPGITAGAFVSVAVNAGATLFVLDAGHAATATAEVTLTFGTAPYTFQVPHCQTTNLGFNVTYDGVAAAAGVQLTLALVAPAAPALTPLTQYWYRMRYRFVHGAGKATTNQAAVAPGIHTVMTGAGPNIGVDISTIPDEIRSDYIGWTIERTKAGGTINGPFYFLADGTGPTYPDRTADADLGYRSDENVHGEPPHFEGVLAFKDRLVAWGNSTLWFSQSVGDIEATGICNWNALNAADIGPDDGDSIKAVVLQVDRLVVLKRWSVWAVEGDDINSYRAFSLLKGSGCAGPRAAASVGGAVFFFGDGGSYRIRGNAVEPFGWVEVGHIFKTFKAGQNADVVIRNYLGQFLVYGFSSSSIYNDDGMLYDLRFGAWTRITGWNMTDIIVQKAGTFGNAQTVVTVDRRDRDATAGFDYPVWLNFFGFMDEKASNGTGGSPPSVVIETPMIDDGAPDTEKDWESIELFLSGTSISCGVTITTDPFHTSALDITTGPGGALWGAPTTWGLFTWAQAIDSGPAKGLPSDTMGRRYSVRLVVRPTGPFTFKGYALDGTVLPKSDFSGV